jgi:competence protein ComEC
MRVPAALAVLPFVAGALTGLLWSPDAASGFAAGGAAGALLSLLAALGASSVGAFAESSAAIAIGFTVAGASLGTTSAAGAYHPSLLAWFGSRTPGNASAPASIEGLLREDAAMSNGLVTISVDVRRAGGTPVRGGLRLSVGGVLAPGRSGEWRAGRRVRITALLRLPSTYFDPGVRDDRRALARRGIVLLGTVKSAAMVEVVGRGSAVQEAAAAARAWVRVRLAAAVGGWSERSAAIATAVLIGDRTGLPDADTRRLQDAGTYHVIAISGGNIAILTLILLGAFGGAGLAPRAAAAGTILLLLMYREVVVPSPSVQRAVSAAVVYLSARVLDHRGAALNVLAIAGILGVAVAPVVLLDPGFILSFGATLGILIVADRQHPGRDGPVTAIGPALHGLWVLLWTTLAAEAALLPIAAVLFGRVTFAGLLLNFAAIPLMTLLQAASLGALALSPFSSILPLACGYVVHLAALGLLESARLTDVVPGLARDVFPPAWWVIASYYAAALTMALASGARVRQGSAAALAVATLTLVSGPAWAVDAMSPPTGGVRVVFLDVGQGDATAIVLPGGRAVLVDAGGLPVAGTAGSAEGEVGFDVGQRVVAPALRALGVRHLDAFAITHGDPDHIGGGPAVMRAFRPPSAWEGVPVPPHRPLRALAEMADALGIHWRTVQTGDADRIGPVRIRVLHPPRPDWERQRVRNEDSIVLDVRVGDVSIVLPGDIGQEGEQAILAHLEPARVVVLKAPHHGSATSSTPGLLAALRPAAVIFSAGRDNRFGHPAAPVVARVRTQGAAVFSTAADGAVILDTDGMGVSIRGWRGVGVPFTASTRSQPSRSSDIIGPLTPRP